MKARAAPKSRPKTSLEKSKTNKQVSESTAVQTPSPVATTTMTAPPPALADDPFPTVTSSGRMVKKSIASTLAAQSALSSKKKPAGMSTTNADGSHPRSRSHSVMPRASVDPEPEKDRISKADDARGREDDEAADEDDKLYCICRTKYDEDRVMIACDR